MARSAMFVMAAAVAFLLVTSSMAQTPLSAPVAAPKAAPPVSPRPSPVPPPKASEVLTPRSAPAQAPSIEFSSPPVPLTTEGPASGPASSTAATNGTGSPGPSIAEAPSEGGAVMVKAAGWISAAVVVAAMI